MTCDPDIWRGGLVIQLKIHAHRMKTVHFSLKSESEIGKISCCAGRGLTLAEKVT